MMEKNKFDAALKEFAKTLQGHISSNNGQWSIKGFIDVYQMNYNKILIPDVKGGSRKITNLKDFVEYKKGDISLIVIKNNGNGDC